MNARHLRLVIEEPAPLDATAAHQAVGDLGQRFALQLMDALAALLDAHEDPAEAARDVAGLRSNLVHIADFTFGVALEKAQRRQAAQ